MSTPPTFRLSADFPHGVLPEALQTSFGRKDSQHPGPWDRFSGRPPPQLHASGNLPNLDESATAFLCSTKCPGDKILEAYDWARQQCDQGGTVISGFQTPVEKDVLAILARRGANIIWAPARDLPKTLDATFKTPMEERRLLILSCFPYGKPSRPTKESCSVRNQFILDRVTQAYIPHVAEGSSLAKDLEGQAAKLDLKC